MRPSSAACWDPSSTFFKEAGEYAADGIGHHVVSNVEAGIDKGPDRVGLILDKAPVGDETDELDDGVEAELDLIKSPHESLPNGLGRI